MRKQSNNWERLARHISVCDYKNVNTVLSVAMKNGSSPSAMVTKLSNTVQGLYTPHPTATQFDIDLAYLMQSIGGPRLLFAMNSTFNLPSYRSLMRRQKVLPSFYLFFCISIYFLQGAGVDPKHIYPNSH